MENIKLKICFIDSMSIGANNHDFAWLDSFPLGEGTAMNNCSIENRSLPFVICLLRSLKTSVADFHPPFGNYILTFHQKERSEEHTSELQSRGHLVCRLLLE